MRHACAQFLTLLTLIFEEPLVSFNMCVSLCFAGPGAAARTGPLVASRSRDAVRPDCCVDRRAACLRVAALGLHLDVGVHVRSTRARRVDVVRREQRRRRIGVVRGGDRVELVRRFLYTRVERQHGGRSRRDECS